MKFTNKHNLPGPLFRALTHDAYYNPAKFSATSLNKSTRMRILEQRHWDEIEEDASSRLWLLLGNMGHQVLELAGKDFDTERAILEIGEIVKDDSLEIEEKIVKMLPLYMAVKIGGKRNSLIEETLGVYPDAEGNWHPADDEHPAFLRSTLDRYSSDGIIEDWKFTSTGAV